MSTKVVVVQSPHSFRLAPEAVKRWQERTGKTCADDGYDIPRTDPDLVHLVETMGPFAGYKWVQLGIRTVPKGTRYVVLEEGDGGERLWTEDEFEWQVA